MTLAPAARNQETVRIADAPEREVSRICGRIVAIVVEPSDAAPALTARIDDESGRVDAVFMGRRAISGIEPGRRIAVEGRVCMTESIPRIFNPRYELQCQQ